MKIPLLLFTLFSFAALLYSSKDVWIAPNRYIENRKHKRAKYSFVWSMFPLGYLIKPFDKYPKFELWYSRVGLLLMYLTLIFGLILILTDSLY